MIDTVAGIGLDPNSLQAVPVEDAVFVLITHVVRIDASDLYLGTDEHDGFISVRHQGILKPLCRIARDGLGRIINHMRAMAGMPVGKKQWPADGRWLCSLFAGDKVDLRINTIPTLWGEDMTVRMLRRDSTLHDVNNLGYDPSSIANLRDLLTNSSGLILVTGPTGAGKTTTLYSCINYVNDGKRKINTIEDPIEYQMRGVRQSQVRADIDLDFPKLLRSVLRQAPDVIMIGEIRDVVTAETAVLAANSGHLVLATLHAPNAASCINTLFALNVNPRFLASSLLGAVSQRLVRRLCDACKVEHSIANAPHTFEDVRPWLEADQGDRIYSAPGCEKCFFEGYRGLTAVAEVLRVERDIRQMIHERRSAADIRAQAVESGMLDLRRAALLKVAQGITSTEEVVRTIPSEYLMPDD